MICRSSIVVCAALFSTACASSPQRPAAGATPPEPPLPRSSISAVLQHKGELQLSEEQVRRLQDLNDQLERQNAALRQEADKKKAGGQPPSNALQPGMGGRSRGGMGGHATGGKRGAPSNANGPMSAEERMDDNDTNAYLEAEKVFSESQRPRALEIASRFREESWDRRHRKQPDR